MLNEVLVAPPLLTPATRRIVAQAGSVDTTSEIGRLLPALTRARILHDGVTADLRSVSGRIDAVFSELGPLRRSFAAAPNRSTARRMKNSVRHLRYLQFALKNARDAFVAIDALMTRTRNRIEELALPDAEAA